MSAADNTFIPPEPVAWNRDRTKLVRYGDVEAAYLAYPAGEEVALSEAQDNGLYELFNPKPAVKAAAKPADKMVAKPADK